ncbi:MAG: putative carbohydrate transporter-like, permease [Haloplasmataceae bacterium]|jgi:multiple sugar transport system permease protein|nr:putative carbohydrate transporter-like, permease [Haloplasmataceae bacterium]
MIKDSTIKRSKVTLSNKYKNIYEKRFSSPLKRRLAVLKASSSIVSLGKYVILFGLSFIILYPIIQQLAVALRAPEDINNPLVLWIPEKFSFKNFEISMIILDYWNAFKNTFKMSFIVMFLQLFSTSLAGYMLARLRFKGSGIIFALVMFTIIVPQTTIELPLKLSLTNFLNTGVNLLGKSTTLYLFAGLGMGLKSGIFIYLFRQFFRGVPEELEEAAYVDGASPIQVFYKIMLPNAKGVMITVAILAFVWQWNDSYFTSVFVTDANVTLQTLTTKMMGISGNIQSAISQAGVWQLFDQDVTKNPLFTSMILNTSGVIAMLPLLLMYVLLQKKLFTEGIERSGIVG